MREVALRDQTGVGRIGTTLWLAAMHAGAWFEWQVRRTPIAYGTDWFYAEMYHEYVREPGGWCSP